VHHANQFNGHAHLLARYCGLDGTRPPRVHGYLQPGWSIDGGLAPGTPYVSGSPIFLWSERTRRRAWSLGRRNAVVTGAPWIYLQRLEPECGAVTGEQRQGTIFYLSGGGGRPEAGGDHHRLVATIREVETGPVTVCLHRPEFRSRRIRRAYEGAGFRVVCHGYPGDRWQGTDTRFLYRQLAGLRRHRRVASNRLDTAVWYGILAGCEPAVYGDPMASPGEDPAFGALGRTRRQWPDLHGPAVDLDLAREAAHAELGTRFLAAPGELREMFGWPRPGARREWCGTR
jgi:hypothetical protein